MKNLKTLSKLKRAAKFYGINVRVRNGKIEALLNSGPEKVWQFVGNCVESAAKSLAERLFFPGNEGKFWTNAGL